MKHISIITVNFNQSYVTEQLLNSINLTNSYKLIEIIVIDNGSTVNSVPEWVLKYPEYTFIRSDENLGFAGGNNLGIRKATGDYLFLVNNDTEFTSGLIEKLVDVIDNNPSVGMVSPQNRYFDEPQILKYMG